MSDEYASSGLQGSLVNESAQKPDDTAYKTGNYPPPDDTTASGGYGSQNTFSGASQRGRGDIERAGSGNNASTGFIDQSINDGPIGDEIQDVRYTDARGRQYKSGTASGNDGDVGVRF